MSTDVRTTTDPTEPENLALYENLGEGMYDWYVEAYEAYMVEWVEWAVARGFLDGPEFRENGMADVVAGALEADPPLSEGEWLQVVEEAEEDAYIEHTQGPL